MTNRRECFLKRIKAVLKEGRLFDTESAVGLSMILRTEEEMDLMEKFFDENPQADHDEIIEYAVSIKNREKDNG